MKIPENWDPSKKVGVWGPLRALKGEDSPTAVEGAVAASPEITGHSVGEPQQTGDSETEGATGERDSVPSFLPTGIFKLPQIPRFGGGQTLPLIP